MQMLEEREHPTVEKIYNRLIDDIPTLSKTTVYNTLTTFLQHDVATCLTIEGGECRYDIRTEIHGHFMCQECGKIYDFDVDISGVMDGLPEGFLTSETGVYLKGICRACQAETQMRAM